MLLGKSPGHCSQTIQTLSQMTIKLFSRRLLLYSAIQTLVEPKGDHFGAWASLLAGRRLVHGVIDSVLAVFFIHGRSLP